MSKEATPQKQSAARRILAAFVTKAFQLQQLGSHFDMRFGEVKQEILEECGKEIQDGGTFPEGKIVIVQKSVLGLDREKLISLVKSGMVQIEAIVNLATFSQQALASIVALLPKDVAEVLVTSSPADGFSMQFRAEPCFKQIIAGQAELLEAKLGMEILKASGGPTKPKLLKGGAR